MDHAPIAIRATFEAEVAVAEEVGVIMMIETELNQIATTTGIDEMIAHHLETTGVIEADTVISGTEGIAVFVVVADNRLHHHSEVGLEVAMIFVGSEDVVGRLTRSIAPQGDHLWSRLLQRLSMFLLSER